MERSLDAMRARHDRTLPNAIDARLERLEEIVEFLFRATGNQLNREGAFMKIRKAELAARRAAAKKRKAKPVKPRQPRTR